MEYEEFLKGKEKKFSESGFEINENELNKSLKDFQKHGISIALKKGKFAFFFDCGLGKTFCQLEWSKHVSNHTGKKVLILVPLAIVEQTKKESVKFNIPSECFDITNYDQLKNIDVSIYGGVVLDESSILKGRDGKMSKLILETFKSFKYKLACSATPSPNDHMELGQHSEFLGGMTYQEMLAMYFVHDGGETSKWRLRKHAEAGMIYHSRVTIWKNPVTEMQRTKALGLLHKTIKKDSAMTRVGIPDYVLLFRNEGDNLVPITHQDSDPSKSDYLPVDLWQKYASPVWYDIDYSRTLQYRSGRDVNDEKHITPLQLDTIERILHLYSNEGEVVFSPFGGIGSEGYVALKMNRKSISIELKDSYFKINKENHERIVNDKKTILKIF